MASGRVEQTATGGWAVFVPQPDGSEERVVFPEPDQAAQALALVSLYLALRADDAAEKQRLVAELQVSGGSTMCRLPRRCSRPPCLLPPLPQPDVPGPHAHRLTMKGLRS